MIKHSLLFVLLLSSSFIFAQRGGRIGVINGIVATQLQNANDDAIADDILLLTPTKRWHKGLELGYSGRFFGFSTQIMHAPIAQNYRSEYFNMNAKTNIDYLRTSLLLNFTTSQKKQIRFSSYLGICNGMQVASKDVVQFTNPQNKYLQTLSITNTDYLYQDSVTVKSTLSESIYHPYDFSAILGLGLDFKAGSNWLISTSFRFDKGLIGVDNNNVTTRSTYLPESNTTVKEKYDHWGYLRAKYIPDYANLIRAKTTTLNYGVFVSVKYMIISQKVKEYELYE